MHVGTHCVKGYTKEEFIKLIEENFKDCDNFERIAFITEISEYKGDTVQSVLLSKNVKL